MKNFRLESFKKIFSFIPDNFGGNIDVQKIDEGFLTVHYEDYYWDGSLGSSREEYVVDFILENGEVLLNAVKIGEHSGSNYAHSQEIYRKGETIAEAIDRLNVADKIKYIAVYSTGSRDWSGQEFRNWNDLTIYKTAKNENIEDILLKLKEEVDREVRKSIDF